ncbi:MAG: tetratricopeptide repeat protein [Pseudomonadota bacterium]
MNSARIHAFILAFVTATTVGAADTPQPRPEPEPKDAALEQARAAIAKQDWAGAQGILRDAVARNPQSADYHNLYAYSIRKGANPGMDLLFRHYNEALRLDSKHRGAHEYIGEAYLMSGNVPKAKEHLAQLDKLCTFGCEEYTKLKKEVAGYEQQHATK